LPFLVASWQPQAKDTKWYSRGQSCLFRRSVDSALVVYERDGAPLSNDEGRVALIVLTDVRLARHAKRFKALTLRAALAEYQVVLRPLEGLCVRGEWTTPELMCGESRAPLPPRK
jgi:hypothetical protein